MPSPSLDDLLAEVSPSRPKVLAWLRAKVATRRDPSKPLEIPKLLRLGCDIGVGDFDNEDDEALEEWLAVAQPWGLARLLEGADGEAWCSDALKTAWKAWRRALERAPSHDAKAVDGIVRIATTPASTRKELQEGLRVYNAFPSHTSPPPYAGHFYGAIHSLLKARLASSKKQRLTNLGECLSFCTVSPTGASLASAVTSKKKTSRKRR